MKKRTLLTALLLVCNFAGYLFAQKLTPNAVPLAVRSELMRRYPDAGKATWEKRGANYQAHWGGKINKDNSALFTPASAFISMSNPADVKFLPIAVKSYVQVHYHTPIVSAAKAVSNIGKITYEIKIAGNKYLIFNSEGRFLKAE
jgi:hypothetical protein